MILLQASHLAKQYDGHEVLLDAGVLVQSGERVALVGANGAGKSTLLRIVVGEETSDSGDVSLGKGVTLGYVSQRAEVDESVTVYEWVAASFSEVFALEKRMRDLEVEMGKPEVYEDAKRFDEISGRYDRLRHEFEEAGGYAVESRIRRVLDGLNFPRSVHQNAVQSLSGGQKTRLSLARLLAWQPDILVLDEPTNYLDTETLTWLEDYLQGYPGAILVVSHDRYFLDRVASIIYELAQGATTRYVGNYSAYVEQKAAQLESEYKRYEAQQAQIARTEEFIEKNIARASTTKRAQSRRKLLARMERMDRPLDDHSRLGLEFKAKVASGKDVLRLEGLIFGRDGLSLAPALDLYIARGDRLAIVGPNGIGKTTLLKTLVGELSPISGAITWGAHVDLGYYDQEQTALDNTKTALSQVWDEYPTLDQTAVRTALGRFLFRGPDVEKPVVSLSGGERSRLALCLLMLEQSNALILDEPTNHLDIMSKEVLEDALADYDGTLIFVSHDRYFIDALATHVLAIDEYGWKLYLGNYSDYVRKQGEDAMWNGDENITEGGDTEEMFEFDMLFHRQTGASPSSTSARSASGPASSSTPSPPSTSSSSVPLGRGGGASGGGTGGAGGGGAGMASGSGDTGSAAAKNAGASSRSGSSGGRVRSADLRKLREKVASLEAQIATTEERQAEVAQALLKAGMELNHEAAAGHQKELEDLNQTHEALLEEWEETAALLEDMESRP